MYVGFDIGGTTIKYGVLDETGAILEKNMLPTNYDPQSFYQNLITIINEAKSRYPIAGIGISAPGIVQKDGLMLTAGAIKPLYGENFKTTLEECCGLPVSVENDANAAAIAEKWIGNAQSFSNYLCLVLGTGVGGGIVINDQVYRGAHGMAGEFGWMVIDALPSTGNSEEVSINRKAAVVDGLVRIYNQKGGQLAGFQATTDAREIFQRTQMGETLAETVTQQFLTDLSVGLINLISCFDPEAILIGGGISANPYFFERLQQTLTTVETQHAAINYLRGKTIAPVLPAKLQNDAGLIGAVYQIHQQLTR
ncbi:MAG: ROK family protein [Enterococcus sp.]|uniref:ROK family protein n=1 Tax=Enterococcus sp. TaxID=35783 RepID=UPI00399F3DFA